MNSTEHFEAPDKQEGNGSTKNNFEKPTNGSDEDGSSYFENTNMSSIVHGSRKRRHSDNSDSEEVQTKNLKSELTETLLKIATDVKTQETLSKTTTDVNNPETLPKITTYVNHTETLPKVTTCVNHTDVSPKTTNDVNNTETVSKTAIDINNPKSLHDDFTDDDDEKHIPSINDPSDDVNPGPSSRESVAVDSDESSSEQSSASLENNYATTTPIRPEAEHLPTLYRLLRDDERIADGLTAKYPNSQQNVAYHVAIGSRQASSQFISTCATISAAKKLLCFKLCSKKYKFGNKDIAVIDVASLPENVEIIDLRSKKSREQYECGNRHINSDFHKYAECYQEVLLVGRIPPSCLTLYNNGQ